MFDAIDVIPVAFDLKQHAVVPDPQAVFGREVGQAFHVTRQTIFQHADLLKDAPRRRTFERVEVFNGGRLEFYAVSHGALRSIAFDNRDLFGRQLIQFIDELVDLPVERGALRFVVIAVGATG